MTYNIPMIGGPKDGERYPTGNKRIAVRPNLVLHVEGHEYRLREFQVGYATFNCWVHGSMDDAEAFGQLLAGYRRPKESVEEPEA